MSAEAPHHFFGCGLHEVYGLAIARNDGILRRLHPGAESEDIVAEGKGFIHVGNSQQGSYFPGGVGCGDGFLHRLVILGYDPRLP
jgi:hypothetical protein